MRGSDTPGRGRNGSHAWATALGVAVVTIVLASMAGAGVASGSTNAPAVQVSVGYADTVHGDSFLPSPWAGDTGVIFAGESGAQAFDAGAVRVAVPPEAADSVAVFDASVDVGSHHFALWGGFLPVLISPGESLILTSTDGENFDTSDTGNGCANNGVIPVVHLTFADSSADYSDNDQVLNTGGRDLSDCLSQNEGQQWSAVGEGDADVGVDLVAKPASVTPGQDVEFTSTVINHGPAGATGVQLFETLPLYVGLVSATPSQGSCVPDEGNSVFCSLGSIANGASATVDVVVQTPADFESASSTVQVSAIQHDPNDGNNSAGADAGACTTDCTGGWVDDGGRIDGPPIGDGVTQSATLIAPTGVQGPVSSQNSKTSPCEEPPDFETYGQVFIVDGPVATKGRVYLNRFKFVTSKDTSVGVPPHEPLKDVTLLRKCVEIPRCQSLIKKASSIPNGFEGCVYKVHRDMRTKIVTISELDTGDDPPIRGGG